MHRESDGTSGEGSDSESHVDSEEETSMVLRVNGADPKLKVEMRSWMDLREQLKNDIVDAHKQKARLTTINQFLLLRNFATLRIKGIG